MPSSPASIELTEYIQRRRRLLDELASPPSPALVFAGDAPPPRLGRWRPDAHFLYLTGIDREPGAAVLFDPTAEDPKRRCIVFLRPLNPELERWEGARDEISSALKSRTGFETVMRLTALPRVLTGAARRAKRLACLHPFSAYESPVSPDFAVFKKVAERIPGVTIDDRTMLLPAMRAVKSPAELDLMRRAAAATAAGFQSVLATLRPGMNEAEVDRALESVYRDHGADGVAYNSIVGGGFNSTVLHYEANNAPLQGGDLLVIDSGAEYAGYAADVTRTFPVGGVFSPEQRAAYELVLRAQEAAIKAARPGATFTDVDNAARAVIDAAGHADAFIHGTGHHLGLEVHDANPDGPLKPGMVITIEPGVYFPSRNLGVRIEDDILITASGNENLTAAIPKTIDAVERAMRR